MEQEKLREWKETLQREIKDLQARLAPVERELKVKQEQLAAIDRLLDLEAHPIEAISSVGRNSSVGPGSNNKRVADVAYEVLGEVGAPTYYRELCEAIQQTGFEIRGKDPATNLIAHISSDPRFERVKRGTYALREWRSRRKRK
jgi:hypothetical protein